MTISQSDHQSSPRAAVINVGTHDYQSSNGDMSRGFGISEIRRVCYIGAGYVGGLSAVVMASKNPELHVDVVDKSPEVIAAWNSDCFPIIEPGLEDIFWRGGPNRTRLTNITFTTNTHSCIAKADIIFLCVDTPSQNGRHANLDTTSLNAAVLAIGAVSRGNTIVVEKSTVPFGTAEQITKILNTKSLPGSKFAVLSNPEFLAQGTAISNLLRPNRVVIGSLPGEPVSEAVAALVRLYNTWIPSELIVTMDAFSSELSKLAANAFIAQRISSINSLSAICEVTGADVDYVSRVVGMEPRIGPRTLKAGFGFGGSCLQKDVLCLVYLAKSLGLDEVAAYWQAVIDLNDFQNSRISNRVLNLLEGSFPKKVSVFGFSFKNNTADTRNSPAIQLVRDLLKNGVRVGVYDPHVTSRQMQQDLGFYEYQRDGSVRDTQLTLNSTPHETCKGASVLVIQTGWEAFGDSGPIEWQKISDCMSPPKILLCPYGNVNLSGMEKLGFNILKIGKRFELEPTPTPVANFVARKKV